MAIWNGRSGQRNQTARCKRRQTHRQGRRQQWLRKTHIEEFEPRNLMAATLRFVGVLPNTGGPLVEGQVRSDALRELTFRFDEGQSISEVSAQQGGIQILRAGGDGVFGNANDVDVTPTVSNKAGWIGVGDRPNEIVVRFTDDLIDDLYQIRIVGGGAAALRNSQQMAFNNGVDRTLQFELDLGPRVMAIVPQPLERVNGTLVQVRDEIKVYFNDDDLDPQAATNPSFYQLIRTRMTADNLDDGPAIHPTSVIYDAAADMVRLSFADEIALLDPTESTYRLRIGNQYTEPLAPIVRDEQDTGEAADTFAGAVNINQHIGATALGSQTVVVQAQIHQVSPFEIDLPGGNDEPGHRDLPADIETPHVVGGDATPGIKQLFYNFRDDYGLDPQGNPLFNLITPAQKQRAREVFAYYSHYLGLQFVESYSSGLTIATGDLRAVNPDAMTGPGGISGIASGTIAVMDSGENWGSSEVGGRWFE